MSLRGVHILFILLSVLLSFGFAAYEWMAYQRSGGAVDCIIAVIAAVIGAGLVAYGVWFVRKPSSSKL